MYSAEKILKATGNFLDRPSNLPSNIFSFTIECSCVSNVYVLNLFDKSCNWLRWQICVLVMLCVYIQREICIIRAVRIMNDDHCCSVWVLKSRRMQVVPPIVPVGFQTDRTCLDKPAQMTHSVVIYLPCIIATARRNCDDLSTRGTAAHINLKRKHAWDVTPTLKTRANFLSKMPGLCIFNSLQ